MAKHHKQRARQQRQTHRDRKGRPEPVCRRRSTKDEERHRRMIRDPWRGGPDGGMALALSAGAAALLSARRRSEGW